MSARISSKLLIIGWEGADWKVVNALMSDGGMPSLRRLIDSGARGELSSLDPKLSSLLWSSAATGKTADKHGILSSLEPDPAGTGLRPRSGTGRTTKALWNMLTQAGLRTNAVNWPVSHPAEAILGSMVSNLFQEGMPLAPDAPWTMSPGAVHPAELTGMVQELRLHPSELTGEELLPLLPDLRGMDPSDPRVLMVAALIARTASIHNVVTALVESPPGGAGRAWDCTMAFFDGIELAQRHFMAYYASQASGKGSPDLEMFKHVVPGTYALHDQMLGRLIELAGPDATVILLSGHGFFSDQQLPGVAPHSPYAAGDAGRFAPLGLLAMSGPGIKPGLEVHGASILDITPTALTLLGLPIGADMDGRVLIEAIDRPVQLERLFGWDEGLGEPSGGVALADSQPGERAPDISAQAALCERESLHNLGTVYMSTSRPGLALPVFERLAANYPDDPRSRLNHAQCLYAMGRYQESVSAADALLARCPDLPDAQLLRGGALFAVGKEQEAAAALDSAVGRSQDRPDLLCIISDAYIRLKRWDEAGAMLTRAESLDPTSAAVHVKRAELEIARGNLGGAVNHCLRAAELRHFYPEAHYTLGVALTGLKNYDDAIRSFRVALSMRPDMLNAHRYIASIYRHLNDRFSARPHREAAERLIRARASGEASPSDALVEPPLGPQDWARKLAPPDRGQP